MAAAAEPGNQAQAAADERREDQRAGADQQGDPGAVDHAREDVAADVVGSEQVRGGGRSSA